MTMKRRNPSTKDLKIIFFRKNYFSQKIHNYFTKETISSRKILALSSLNIDYPHHNAEDNIIWTTILAAGNLAYNQDIEREYKTSLALQASKEIADAFANAKANDQIAQSAKTIKRKRWFRRNTPFVNFEKIYDDWLPIAKRSMTLSFSYEKEELPKQCTSCAYELIKKMGGTEEEAIIASGLSGGIGLGGGLCGAFVAKAWYEAIKYLGQNPNENHYPHKRQKLLFKNFKKLTNGQYLCPDLSGKKFHNVEHHSDFIIEGGCNKLISIISNL